MADVRAIHAVGSSLIGWLRHAYEAFSWPGGEAKPDCTFQLASSQQLVGTPTFDPGIIFYLYRVVPNEHVRRAPRDSGRERPTLALDLHYLTFAWAANAKEEALTLAWTMRMLESHPVLGPGDLIDGGFGPSESVQIVLGELSNEDLMRIWDAIEPPYRLSVPYIARIVQLDLQELPEARPVVARKLVFEQIGPGDTKGSSNP